MSISTFIKNFNEFMNDEEPMGRNEDFSGMDWWEPLKAMLRGKHNMELLGRGHFSAAFTHPEDETKVIKIGFKKEDAGAAYAAFCRQNQGLYGIPNVYHIQRLSKAYIVILDRLEDYRHFDGYQNISDQYREAGTIIEGGRP